MKQFKQFLLAVLVALTSSVTANAYDFEVDGIYYNFTSSNTCEVTFKGISFGTYINDYSGTIAIPSSVTYNSFTYSVTSIGEDAFVNCKSLKSLNLPNTITKIGPSAFSCSGLFSINLPNSVTEIGFGAFGGCTNLTNPVYNNSIFAYLPETYQGEYQVPDGITLIAGQAFYRCFGLSSVSIPSSVTEIGYNAFGTCTNLKAVEIPNSVSSIKNQAFYGCTGLTSVYLGNTVSEIESYAFGNCAFSSIEIPSSVVSIGGGAFQNCTNLTSVKYNANNQTSGSNSNFIFSGCNALKEVIIGENVKNIPSYTFAGCTNLTTVVFPNSVTDIGDYVFMDCNSLTTPIFNNTIFVKLPISYVGDYKISEGTLVVAGGAFNHCVSLTSVDIPNSVTVIGSNAFSDCPSLSSPVYNNTLFVRLPVSYEGEYNIPDGISEIVGYAFSNCSELQSTKIPNSITKIGNSAFYKCTNMTSVVIGNSVTEIEGYGFGYCKGLEEIISLSTTPPNVDSYTFYGFSKDYCKVKVPKEAIGAYQMADGWKYFKNIEAYQTCDKPTILLVDGKLYFETATEGAHVEYSITSEDFRKGIADKNTPVSVTGQYTISAYAVADDYCASEIVTATLVWVNPTLEGSNIINMEAKKAVLIRTNGNSLQISGTELGEKIEIYTVGGVLLNSVSAKDDETIIPCNINKGEIIVIKYGDKAIKYKL